MQEEIIMPGSIPGWLGFGGPMVVVIVLMIVLPLVKFFSSGNPRH
jgi:hypothetical protein